MFLAEVLKITKKNVKLLLRHHNVELDFPYSEEALKQYLQLDHEKVLNYKITLDSSEREIIKIEIGTKFEEEENIDVDLILRGIPQKRRSRVGILLEEIGKLMGKDKRCKKWRAEQVLGPDHRMDAKKLIDSLITAGRIVESEDGEYISFAYDS